MPEIEIQRVHLIITSVLMIFYEGVDNTNN